MGHGTVRSVYLRGWAGLCRLRYVCGQPLGCSKGAPPCPDLPAEARVSTHASLGVDMALGSGKERLCYHRTMLIILFHGSPPGVKNNESGFIYWVVFQVPWSCVELGACSIRIHLSPSLSDYLSYGYLNERAQIPEEAQISSAGALWLVWGKWVAYITIVWTFYTLIFFVPWFSKFSQVLKAAWPKIIGGGAWDKPYFQAVGFGGSGCPC